VLRIEDRKLMPPVDLPAGTRAQTRWFRALRTGERLWTFHGVTYGCVDESAGAALSEQRGEYSFFEFPYDAFKLAADGSPESTESTAEVF
jgi:hypothetical protein